MYFKVFVWFIILVLLFILPYCRYKKYFNQSKIKLFTCYYTDKVEERQKELDFCIYNNIDNKLISKIFLIMDKKEFP